MDFLDKMKKTADLWFPDEQQINTDKGRAFEKYVAELFTRNEKYFSILDWTKDYYDKRDGIKVESNKNPDLVICYKPTNKSFAIECKFKTNPYFNYKRNISSIKWARPDQIKRYNDFSKEKDVPVFIVIGLSGEPNNPERMFSIPLADAKYSEIFLSVLEKHERDPQKTFFWKDGTLS